jgi:hypothetical protein
MSREWRVLESSFKQTRTFNVASTKIYKIRMFPRAALWFCVSADSLQLLTRTGSVQDQLTLKTEFDGQLHTTLHVYIYAQRTNFFLAY